MDDCDEIDFKADDIEDFLNESFMVLDEVEEFRQKMVSYDKNRLNEKNNSLDGIALNDDDIEMDNKSTEEDPTELDDDGEKAERNSSFEENGSIIEAQSHTASEGLEDGEVKEEEDNIDLTHPYLCLLECYELTPDQKTATSMESRKPLKGTEFQTLSTDQHVTTLLKTLRKTPEISIDLLYVDKADGEYLSLMTLSTRNTDYILDAKLLKHTLIRLTEIFINPKIVKVIYDAETVLGYLQRNLHLYLVNMFDVKKALEVLESKDISWNTILKEKYSYVIEEHQKQIDLKQRPLTFETKAFCRATAHYLIDSYHECKSKLLNKDKSVYDKLMKEFRETSKIIFPIIQRYPIEPLATLLKNRQMCELFVLKRLFHWRSGIAKKMDKNPDMVISKQILMKLASTLYDYSPLIFTINQSPVVQQHVNQIINLITKAKIKFKIFVPTLTQKKRQYIDYLLVKLDELGEKPPYNKRKLADSFESNQNKQRQSAERQKTPQSPPKKPKLENTNLRNSSTNKKPHTFQNKVSKFQTTPSPSKFTKNNKSPNIESNSVRSNSSYDKKSNVNTNKSPVKRYLSPPRSNKSFSKNSNNTSTFVAPPKQIPSLFASTSTTLYPNYEKKSNWKEPLLPSPPNQNKIFANNSQFLAPANKTTAFASDNQFMAQSSQRQVFLNSGTNAFLAPPNEQTYINNAGTFQPPYSNNPTAGVSNQFPNMIYSIKESQGANSINSNDNTGRRKSRFDIPPSQDDYITSYGNHMLASKPVNSSPTTPLSTLNIASATALFKQSSNRPQVNAFPGFNTARSSFGDDAPNDALKRDLSKRTDNSHYNQLFDHALSDIDQKITTLERKVTQFQAKDSDDDYRTDLYRRRYM